MRIQPVILCGGSGTRLWPLSREQEPKQILKLCGERTMLQATALRLAAMALEEGDSLAPPLPVGNEEYRFLIAQQLRDIGFGEASLVLKTCSRNTALALTLAARAGGGDPVLVVMPADHVIRDDEAFCEAVAKATRLADRGELVTFGIQATSPETGYGYIKLGAKAEEGAWLVEQFVEKPDLAAAETYVASG